MDWIKKHYDQFILIVASLLLLVCSVLIILKARSFGENFADAQTNVPPSEKVPELLLKPIQDAERLAAQPAKWQVDKFLFVPEQYIIDPPTGKPKKPGEGSMYNDSLTAGPIPNLFFQKNRLPLLDPTVARQDPDGDNFSNEDEWRGDRDPKDSTKWSGGTDPNDPKSHPQYVTKLFLKQWIRVPFVLRFDAYDGDPAKPADMSFQINTVSRGKRTQFLKIGEAVTGSPFKVEKFEKKLRVNPSTGAEEDVSELTLRHGETGDPVVLVLTRLTDSPDSYALFDYQFNNKPIQVKRLQEFALQPETDKRYKLIDITDAGALIRTPDPGGTDYLVVPDKRPK